MAWRDQDGGDAEGDHFEPMQRAMAALLAEYSEEQLTLIADFVERGTEVAMARVTELNAKT